MDIKRSNGKNAIFSDKSLTSEKRKLFRAQLRSSIQIAKLRKNLLQSIKEIKLIEEGKLTPRTVEEFLNALKVAAHRRNRRARKRLKL